MLPQFSVKPFLRYLACVRCGGILVRGGPSTSSIAAPVIADANLERDFSAEAGTDVERSLSFSEQELASGPRDRPAKRSADVVPKESAKLKKSRVVPGVAPKAAPPAGGFPSSVGGNDVCV